MSSVENKLAEILKGAEAAVLKVLADAAAAGDYSTIDRARVLAQKLRDLNNGGVAKSSIAQSAASQTTGSRKKRKRKKRASKKDNYPQYEIKDGSLYKIGWSKKKNDTYVHRVPISAVKVIANALEYHCGSADPVSSEQILESNVLIEAGGAPSYQVYIVLAYLKDRGVIASAGRDGFQLPAEILSQVDQLLLTEAS